MNERGNIVIETVLFMPFVLMLFFIIIWGGQLMYTWTGVNYAVATAAVDAAKKGQFTYEVRSATAQYLQQWTPGGNEISLNTNATMPDNDPLNIVIWGPDSDVTVQRGENITVGVIYPYKVDSPLLGLLGRSFFGGDVIYLKAAATARSEVYVE